MAVIPRTAPQGPGALLEGFLQARGIQGRPDGRALYRYECQFGDLEGMERLLNDTRFSLEERMRLVPLVAAERFRRSYREGQWSWEHCGAEIARLRRECGARFGPLLLSALAFWGLPVIRGDAMRRQYLDTLVVNGGFPVAFVEGTSALRGLLKRLIAEHVRSGEATAEQRAALEIPVSRLPRSYRQSVDFQNLCVELAGAVAGLARSYDPTAQTLSGYLERIPNWEARLPLRLDSGDAKQLVEELLLTAREARHTDTLDCAVCVRALRFEGGIWHFTTVLAPLPDSLKLSGENVPAVLKLGITADGVAVRQVASLSRQANGRHLVRPRPSESHLRIPPPFDAPGVVIGLVAMTSDHRVPLPVRDGDALDADAPWVFARNDANSPDPAAEHWRLTAQGDMRTRDGRVLLCVPDGARIDGESTVRGGIEFETGRQRLLFEVVGRVVVQCGDESFVIQTGKASDTLAIELKGRQLPYRSPEAPILFAGAPAAEIRDAEPGTVLEWKSSLGQHWSTHPRDAVGLVTYRARIGDEVVARRKALVLPTEFEVSLRTDGNFRLRLADGWFVAGTPRPQPDPSTPGQWAVPAEVIPGAAATAMVMISPPRAAPSSVAWVRLRSHVHTTGFRELVTGSASPATVSLDEVGRYEAFIARHAGRLLHVSWGNNRTMPVVCEVEHADGSSLPLSWIVGDLHDLASSSGDADVSLRLELFDSGVASGLIVAPIRLRREPRRIRATGACQAVGRLKLTVRHFSSDASQILAPDPEEANAWLLPENFEPGWALVTANSPSIRPHAVRFGDRASSSDAGTLASMLQVEMRPVDRIRALGEHFSALAEKPLEPANDADLAFLSHWLQRFRDVPGPYLDIVKALLGAPGPMLKLLTYFGTHPEDPLARRANEATLWWHLVPASAWQALVPWWAAHIDKQGGDDVVDLKVFDSVVGACADSLHVAEDDRNNFAIALTNAVINPEPAARDKGALAAWARLRYQQDFERWHQCLATADPGMPELPPLTLVAELAGAVQRRLSIAFPGDYRPDRLAYLIAPAVCVIAADAGIATAELRRELVIARRFDRSLFDTLFVNARIQMACA